MAGRITLQTIADEVGVSRATVSNAYNHPDQLSTELRDKILTTAERLGYRGPDAAARMLRTGQMNTIGLIFSHDLNSVFNEADTASFLHGVAETLSQAGTGVTLIPVPTGVQLTDTALGSVATDGYVVYSLEDDHPALDSLVNGARPIVIVGEPDLGRDTSFVGIGDRAGGRLAAEHLIQLGHRDLAVVVGRLRLDARVGEVTNDRLEQITVRYARERIAGYRDAMTAAGLDASQLTIWEAGDNDPDAGRNVTRALLEQRPNVTGLLCTVDRLAIGASQAALRMGRHVPDDLSIVGFDDVPRAATWDVPLTTISQPLVDKGRVAAQLLLELIEGRPARRIELPIGLVVRASTGPARTPQAAR